MFIQKSNLPSASRPSFYMLDWFTFSEFGFLFQIMYSVGTFFSSTERLECDRSSYKNLLSPSGPAIIFPRGVPARGESCSHGRVQSLSSCSLFPECLYRLIQLSQDVLLELVSAGSLFQKSVNWIVTHRLTFHFQSF